MKALAQLTVLRTDMNVQMQTLAKKLVTRLLRKYDDPSIIAREVMKDFNKSLKPQWYCFVGQYFGSCVSYQRGSFLLMTSGPVYVMLYKVLAEDL